MQWYNFRASFQFVEIVSPLLHHFPAFINKFRSSASAYRSWFKSKEERPQYCSCRGFLIDYVPASSCIPACLFSFFVHFITEYKIYGARPRYGLFLYFCRISFRRRPVFVIFIFVCEPSACLLGLL